MIGDSLPGEVLRSADTPRWGAHAWDEHHDERRGTHFPISDSALGDAHDPTTALDSIPGLVGLFDRGR